ncbi:MAG TPA: hypothetical protein VIU12_31250 [Chryseolinea sp.]
MKNLPLSVAELQRENVTFELEAIDRMYFNAYVPQLTSAAGVASYFRNYKGHRFASTKEAVEMTADFKRAVLDFAEVNGIPIIRFAKGQRKDDVMQKHLRKFKGQEGVLFIGIAQEKATVPRTVRKRFGPGDGTIPWIDYTTALVNFYYVYAVDEDFGPFFIKFCSYFPYTSKLCLNGHEYLKRQLALRGVDFEPLDNGILSCANPQLAQRLADGFDEKKIEKFFRKWLAKLPHPFPAADRKAGYRYQLSVLQSEFSLTQVWDRPRHGREFFEEVIRENIDLGRPENVQLIFARKMQKKTAADGRCRTRIVTQGVIPSLHVYYKNTHLKQYHKTCAKGAALRTETTINNTYDFGVGRLLKNLPQLREIGFAANHRMLEVEKASHDCRIGAAAFQNLQTPATVDGQRASALRFGDTRVQALFGVLMLLCLQVEGFRNRQLCPLLAQMLGLPESDIRPGRMSYELRRLRLHGLIERIEKTHRYRLTRKGLATVVFYQRTYARLIRPGLSILQGGLSQTSQPLVSALQRLVHEIDANIMKHAA